MKKVMYNRATHILEISDESCPLKCCREEKNTKTARNIGCELYYVFSLTKFFQKPEPEHKADTNSCSGSGFVFMYHAKRANESVIFLQAYRFMAQIFVKSCLHSAESPEYRPSGCTKLYQS